MKRSARIFVIAATFLALVAGVPALADELPPGGSFWDDDGAPEEGYIEAIRAADITRGCNPPVNDLFCPDQNLTRAQMATVFARALGLTPTGANPFVDTTDSVHVN